MSGTRITHQSAVLIAIGYARCAKIFLFVIMSSMGFRTYLHFLFSFFYFHTLKVSKGEINLFLLR